MSACSTCGKCPCYEHERRTVMADPKGKHHGHGNLYCNGNVTAETCWTRIAFGDAYEQWNGGDPEAARILGSLATRYAELHNLRPDRKPEP